MPGYAGGSLGAGVSGGGVPSTWEMPPSKSPTTRSGHAVMCRTISGISDGALTVAAHLGATFARWKRLPGRVCLGVDRRECGGDDVPQRAVGADIVDAPRILGALDVEHPSSTSVFNSSVMLLDDASLMRLRLKVAALDAPLFRCPPARRHTDLYRATFRHDDGGGEAVSDHLEKLHAR